MKMHTVNLALISFEENKLVDLAVNVRAHLCKDEYARPNGVLRAQIERYLKNHIDTENLSPRAQQLLTTIQAGKKLVGQRKPKKVLAEVKRKLKTVLHPYQLSRGQKRFYLIRTSAE